MQLAPREPMRSADEQAVRLQQHHTLSHASTHCASDTPKGGIAARRGSGKDPFACLTPRLMLHCKGMQAIYTHSCYYMTGPTLRECRYKTTCCCCCCC